MITVGRNVKEKGKKYHLLEVQELETSSNLVAHLWVQCALSWGNSHHQVEI
jgi:hypothetical protein